MRTAREMRGATRPFRPRTHRVRIEAGRTAPPARTNRIVDRSLTAANRPVVRHNHGTTELGRNGILRFAQNDDNERPACHSESW